MLITGAGLLDGRVVDIRVDTLITEVAERIPAHPGEDVLDAAGALVLPGLHDHHIHLRAAAAAMESVAVGPPRVRGSAELRRVLYDAPVGADGWIRAVGYHESVAGDLDAAALDGLCPPVPVRVQHRSGAMWFLNSVALQRIGAAGDGRFFRTDPVPRGAAAPSLRVFGQRLVAAGITGVTDATPGYTDTDIEAFSAARQSGELPVRLHCMAIAGTRPRAGVSIGPAKRILDDTDLDLAELTDWITANHDRGHGVAVHTVTDAQLIVTIAALRAAGPRAGDRLEHAAVVPDDCIGDLVQLGVTVVTQPNFVAERGTEYIADIAAAQQYQLWRVATLQAAGIPVALSTDAPFGDADPWAAMRAAVTRTSGSGVVLGPAERIPPEAAIAGFCGHAEEPTALRSITAGAAGDLCIMSAPAAVVLAQLDARLVRATVIAGVRVYG